MPLTARPGHPEAAVTLSTQDGKVQDDWGTPYISGVEGGSGLAELLAPELIPLL